LQVTKKQTNNQSNRGTSPSCKEPTFKAATNNFSIRQCA